MSKIEQFPTVKPCFPYVGGKSRLIKRILPLIPPHKTYVEPFAGGLAVLLAKPRATVECVNDRNQDLVNFYRYVRFHRDAIMGELSSYLNSRRDIQDLMHAKPLTDLQRAVWWYLVKVCSFGAYSDSWGRSKFSYHGFDPNRHLALIEAVSRRLQRVFIECGDWQDVVTFFDKPDTFVYFDPPYVKGDPGSCYDAFSADEMARVRDCCMKLKGPWILSCDDSPICREIFDGLPHQAIEIKYASATRPGKKSPTSGELLVLSPAIAKQLNAA